MSYLITTGDGLQHRLEALDVEALDDYSTSANTRAALAQAIAAGDYTTAPPLPPAPPEPDPAAFRAALASEPAWLAWASTLAPVLYTNLTIAAAQDNWPEAQTIYQAAAALSPPPPEAAATWQALADQYAILITF